MDRDFLAVDELITEQSTRSGPWRKAGGRKDSATNKPIDGPCFRHHIGHNAFIDNDSTMATVNAATTARLRNRASIIPRLLKAIRFNRPIMPCSARRD